MTQQHNEGFGNLIMKDVGDSTPGSNHTTFIVVLGVANGEHMCRMQSDLKNT